MFKIYTLTDSCLLKLQKTMRNEPLFSGLVWLGRRYFVMGTGTSRFCFPGLEQSTLAKYLEDSLNIFA